MHIDADIPGTPLDLYKRRTSNYVGASMSRIYTKTMAAIMRPKLRSSSIPFLYPVSRLKD